MTRLQNRDLALIRVGTMAGGGPRWRSPDVWAAMNDVNACRASSQPTGPQWAEFLRRESSNNRWREASMPTRRSSPGCWRRLRCRGGTAERPEFVKMRQALEQWLAGEVRVDREQLAAAVAAAQEAFVPRPGRINSNATAGAGTPPTGSTPGFNPRTPMPPGGAATLCWDAFRQQIAEPQPDLAALRQVYERLSSEQHGLELVWFHDLRETLRRYLTISEAASIPTSGRATGRCWPPTGRRLSAYESSRSAADAAAVSALLDWLVTLNQASWIVRSVRQPYEYPNLYVEVSDNLIAAGMVEAVDDVRPVRDCILGTSIFGNGHTTGLIDVELTPSPMVAQINTVFRGTLNTNTVGYNGPARIYSTGTTSLVTYKPIYIDAERIWSGPATTGARTRTNIHNIQADRLPFIVERIAWRRAREQKPQAERIAEQHAQDQVSQRADEQAVEELEEANRNYQEEFRRPLLERGLFPSRLRASAPAVICCTRSGFGVGRSSWPGHRTPSDARRGSGDSRP